MDVAKATEGYNGSEIEQCVISGLFEAFNENRALSADDIMRAIGRMVPLSKTMVEDIKRIKRWAFNRAVLASKPEKHEASSGAPPRRDEPKKPQEDIIKTSFS